ncbi:uncharacterized protein LOC126153118 [Schistocerca cancellata]|uniref:uncharacterized protein LOC126153118 n=1 Tax=Schistocerca cancellata TaxID=274614 RepID=UPI0021196F8E|nr:uncharacterized protein LOC126153118 [Schistocerca cancellata]
MDQFLNIFKHNFNKAFPQRKSKSHSSPEFINYFKKYKLVLKRVVKEAKIKENDKYIMKSTNKTKSMWKAVQDLMGKKTTHKNIVISHDGKNVTDPRVVENSFNSYYATVAGKLVKEKSGNPPNTTWKELSSIEINNISMFFSPVSPTELLNTINSLKSKYSTGIDDIPDYIIKITSRQILSPLLDTCNSSLSCGVFPQQLKMAKVIHLYKKGYHQCMGNYRPVSLLAGFSKIIEKVFLSKLITFFGKHNIISGCQDGFRPQSGHPQKYLRFILGPKKSFYVIDHSILLRKLEWYGVRGVLNQWIKPYLEYRSRVTEIKYMEGNELQIHLSEPCGLSHDITKGVSEWFTRNRLIVNTQKTVLMNFHTDQNKNLAQPVICIDNQNISAVNENKFLGIHIQENLKWSTHITALNSKLAKFSYVVRILRNSTSAETVRAVYFAHVHSSNIDEVSNFIIYSVLIDFQVFDPSLWKLFSGNHKKSRLLNKTFTFPSIQLVALDILVCSNVHNASFFFLYNALSYSSRVVFLHSQFLGTDFPFLLENLYA